MPGSGWAQIISFIGSVELYQLTDDPSRAPGDFKNAGTLGIPDGSLTIKDPDAKKKKLSADLRLGKKRFLQLYVELGQVTPCNRDTVVEQTEMPF